jgi:hypothetical protein
MLTAIIGIVLIAVALHDSFEALVLPRRVTRQWRVSRLYYRGGWRLWRGAAGLISSPRYRETALGVFGPLSLLGLFLCWAAILILGFALVHRGLDTLEAGAGADFTRFLYMSGETFFTLGYGDITPKTRVGQLFSVVEAGTGFGFMAVVIGYLPVLYQAFSSRERLINLLDARAGSPPTCSELLRRSGAPSDWVEIHRFLAEWEAWSGELLESHLSFPVLSYYRSQHGNQSWLAALAVVLDTSAVLLATAGPREQRRAQLAFAMARHTCVDLCLVFWLPPKEPPRERLIGEEATRLLSGPAPNGESRDEQLKHLQGLRALYEPFLQALAAHLALNLPRFFPEVAKADNWQTTAWTERAPGITELAARRGDEHFD